MAFLHYIGVDVSKNTLDMAVFKGKDFVFHKVIDNKKIAICNFLKELEMIRGVGLSESVFCMEHTGIYNNPLLVCLHKKRGNVCLEVASQIRYSLGNIRGKSDKIDAIRIGEYVYKNREEIKLWVPKREIVVKLERLSVLRDRLLMTKKQLSVPLKEQKNYIKESFSNLEKRLCQRTLNSLNADLKKVDKQIEKVLREDEHILRLFEIITSVSSVGTQTAVSIITCTNEFKDIRDPKKFACYSGVVPFTRESGLFKGRGRLSHMANKKMKTLLHMCAIVAIGSNKELKAYYLRKVGEGKNKMSVINAVRNKLIHRIFACLRENRKYENNYIKTVA